jgi:hypothetical protein
MSFEEEFDSIIRNKNEGANFPFDEANWTKASAMIDADRAGGITATGFKKFYLPALILGITSLSFLLLYNVTQHDSPSNLSNQNNTQFGEAKDTEKLTAESAITADNASIAQQESTQNNALAKTETIGNTSDKTSRTDALNATNNVVKEIAFVSNTKKTSANLPNKNNEKTNSNAFVNSAPLADNTSEKAADNKVQKQKEEEFSSSNSYKKEQTKNESANNSTSKEEPLASAAVIQNPVFQSAAPSLEQETINAEQLNLIALNAVMQENELRNIPFVLLQQYDEDYYKKLRGPKHFMTIEAGSEYNLGWQGQGARDGKGFNWFGGVNYGYYLCKKMALGLGLQVYNIQNTKQAFYSATGKEYDFGFSNTKISVTSNNLIYLAIPVKAYYALNATNQIGLGFNAAYLVAANSTINTFANNDLASPSISPTTVKDIYKGTNQTNLMASAFYTLRVSKRLGVNAEFMYGLSDIFKNTQSINTTEKPMALRLSLQYTLFNK